MSYLYIICTFATLFLAIIFFSTCFQKIAILKLLLISITVILGEYILVAALLLCAGVFRVEYAIATVCAVNLVLCLVRFKRIKSSIMKIQWNIKQDVIILLVIVVCMIFCGAKTEAIMPVHDAGVYGQEAIDMMYGGEERITHLEEYNTDNGDIIQANEQLRKMQAGIYPATLDNQDISAYQYHGFPVWSAVLALWGKMFGLANMFQVLSLLFACAILGIYYIIDQFAKNKYAKYLAAFFAFLPVAIYLAKEPLTEMLFIMMVVMTIFFLSRKEDKQKYWGLIPLCTLGFIHLTTFVYSPGIFICLVYLALVQKKKIYMQIGVAFSFSILLSLIYGALVSTAYTNSQLSQMFGSSRSMNSLLAIAAIVVIIQLFIQLFIWNGIAKERHIAGLLGNFFQKYAVLLLKIVVIVILAVTLAKIYLMCFTDHYPIGDGSWRYRTYGGSGIAAARYLNLFVAVMITGFVCLPYLAYKIFSKKTEWEFASKAIAALFLYSMAIMVIVKTDTPNLYVTARYFMIFLVPAAIILTGMLLRKSSAVFIMLAVCILTSLPFNINLTTEQMRKNSVTVLQDAVDMIKKDSIVFINQEGNPYLKYLLPMNLRQMNNNLVYLDSVMDEVLEQYPNKKAYYVSNYVLEGKSPILERLYEVSVDIQSINGFYPTKEDFEQNVYEEGLVIYEIDSTNK